jgi:hypothetical protein
MKFAAASLPLLFVNVLVREQMNERVRSVDHKVQRIASPLVCRPAVCCESEGRLWPRQARKQARRQALTSVLLVKYVVVTTMNVLFRLKPPSSPWQSCAKSPPCALARREQPAHTTRAIAVNVPRVGFAIASARMR